MPGACPPDRPVADEPDPDPRDPRPGASTGPRTAAGKARSSLNAVTHGLTARTPLLPGEDPEAFREFVWSVIEDLAPEGTVQAELASRAAVLMWRRRRINEAEQQVFLDLHAKYAEEADDVLAEQEEFAETPDDFAALAEARAEERQYGDERNSRHLLADELAVKPGQLERLARYEQAISRQIDSTLRLLLKLQNRSEWQRRQGRRENGAEPHAPRQAAEPAPASPSTPPPPAPAQNEPAPGERDRWQTQTPAPWTGPPGTN